MQLDVTTQAVFLQETYVLQSPHGVAYHENHECCNVQEVSEDSLEVFWQSQQPSKAPCTCILATSSLYMHCIDGMAIDNYKVLHSLPSQPCCASSEGWELVGAQTQGSTTQPPTGPAQPPPRSHLLVQRLYKHKVDHMVRGAATALVRCTACGDVFSGPNRHKLPCTGELGLGVGPAGEALTAAVRWHVPDRTWRVTRQVDRVCRPDHALQ